MRNDKKTIYIFLGILVAIAAVLWATNTLTPNELAPTLPTDGTVTGTTTGTQPDGTGSTGTTVGGTTGTPVTPTTGTVTITGTTVCLPHKNPNGPQTMECAIGLKATDGKYYGLLNLPPPESSFGFLDTGVSLTVVGNAIAPLPTENYGVTANLKLTQITKN